MNLKPPCEACLARENHIDDLRALLESERVQRTSLINILLGRGGPAAGERGDTTEPSIVGGTSPSVSTLRARARNAEAENKGNEQFWAKRREHYKKVEEELKERISQRVGYKETTGAGEGPENPPEQSDNVKSDPDHDYTKEVDRAIDRATLE